MDDIQCVLHVLMWPAWFVCDVPSIHRHGDPRHRGTKEMMMRRRRMNMVMKMIVMIYVVMINEVMILVVMMRMNGILGMIVSSLT